MFSVMRLEDFFERFDSARDKLKEMSYSAKKEGNLSGLVKDEREKIAYLLENQDNKSRFEGTKYKIKVFGKRCYVPSDVIRNMEFIESTYAGCLATRSLVKEFQETMQSTGKAA